MSLLSLLSLTTIWIAYNIHLTGFGNRHCRYIELTHKNTDNGETVSGCLHKITEDIRHEQDMFFDFDRTIDLGIGSINGGRCNGDVGCVGGAG